MTGVDFLLLFDDSNKICFYVFVLTFNQVGLAMYNNVFSNCLMCVSSVLATNIRSLYYILCLVFV